MLSRRSATRLLNGSGLTVAVGALLAGGVSADSLEPQTPLTTVLDPGGQDDPAASPFSASPEEMAEAAETEKRMEQRRQRRARRLAHRSAGQMLTPTSHYRITAVFGQPGSMWSSGHHTGLDFAGPVGTPIVAALAGKVVQAGPAGAYGNFVVIKHKHVKTCYAHMNSIAVRKGQRVLRGQRIGTIGATGNTTGAHLHFEVLRRGEQRDPRSYL